MTPELSIIIVSWNLQDLIGQAIDSAFAQDLTSCEIIVVDNGSTDGSIEQLRAYESTATHTYKLILNDENRGLGPARNQGRAEAAGKYIVFLDGDDWFVHQTLPRIVALTKTNRADVAVFNHLEVFSSGETRNNRHTNLLKEGDRNDPEIRKTLLRNFNVAWNKVYRSEFIRAQGLKFADGYYEDVDWSHMALILATRVLASDEVVINHRKDRGGSITNSQSPSHMQAIDRFWALLEFAAENKTLCAPYRTYIFERIVRNTLTLLSRKRTRLPKELHPVFFRHVQDLLDAHDPGNDVKVRNANPLVYRLLRSGSFATFNAVKGINGLRLSR